MKAADLMLRECVPEIVEETLRGFLQRQFGGEWKVTWTSRAWRQTEAQCWTCNTYINAIFRSGAKRSVLEIVRREFSRHPVWWRSPLQLAYFAVATWAPTARIMAQAQLEIVPDVPASSGWLMVLGGSKLRIIDTVARIVYCCRKSNANPLRFGREVEARKRAERAGVRTPRILSEVDRDQLVEEMVIGTPPNRLRSKSERELALRSAQESLKMLYEKTAVSTTCGEYAQGLASEAVGLIEESTSLRASIKDAKRSIEFLLRGLQPSFDRRIETVVAHGDFQPGNVLWDGDSSWLIDWEYSVRRQASYDDLTWRLEARTCGGLTDRISGYLREAHQSQKAVQSASLYLFLLEDLLFRIYNQKDVPQESGRSAWNIYLKDCSLACEFLSNYHYESTQ
jgi:hypothetical protein